MGTTLAAAYLILALSGDKSAITAVPYNTMSECVAAERSFSTSVKVSIEHECIPGSVVTK